jgi:predicted short-subunit dehydrogenase-like oxidoreductase (DUF2520 family)
VTRRERAVPSVFILGAGRAGRGLADAFRRCGVTVTGLHGRRPVPGATTGPLPDSLGDADVVIVAVRDAQLDQALDQVSLAFRGRAAGPGKVVLHASGSARPAGLAALRRLGAAGGTFHPLVPLAEPSRAAESLRGAWIGVDGDAEAMDASRQLAARLGARVLEIPRGEKPRYHAAAVFASNFPAVLAALAVRLMREAGVPAPEAAGAVDALLRASVANLEGAEPAAVLTGPVVRGDVDTVRSHIAALADAPAVLSIYRSLSGAAVQLLRDSGAGDPARLADMEAAIDPGTR